MGKRVSVWITLEPKPSPPRRSEFRMNYVIHLALRGGTACGFRAASIWRAAVAGYILQSFAQLSGDKFGHSNRNKYFNTVFDQHFKQLGSCPGRSCFSGHEITGYRRRPADRGARTCCREGKREGQSGVVLMDDVETAHLLCWTAGSYMHHQ